MKRQPRSGSVFHLVAVWLALACLAPVSASAQNGGPRDLQEGAVAVVKTDEAQASIDKLRERLAAAAKAFDEKSETPASLDGLAAEALAISEDAETLMQEFQPRVLTIEARLAQLKPAEGQELSQSARIETESQQRVLDGLSAILQQANVIAVQAVDLSISVTQQQRARFSREIFKRERSVLDPVFWRTVRFGIRTIPGWLDQRMVDWQDNAKVGIDTTTVTILVLLVLGGIYAVLVSRRYVLKRLVRDPTIEPNQTKRVVAALFVTLVGFGSVAVLSLVVLFVLDTIGLIPPPFDNVAFGFVVAISIYALISSLVGALLAPGRPAWRLLPLSARACQRLALITRVNAVVIGLTIAFEAVVQFLDPSTPVTIAARALQSIVIAVLTLFALRAFTLKDPDDDDSHSDGLQGALWRLLLPVGWAASIAALAAPLFGFLALGWFLVYQIVVIALVLALLYLALAIIEEATTTGFQPGYPAGVFLTRTLGFTRDGAEQIGVLTGGILKLLAIAFAGLGILLTWGLTSADLARLENMVTRFQVGGVTISITTVASAIAIFAAGFAATRAIQRWLENRYLPKTKLDVGLKTSIRTGFGYVGVIVAAMVAISHLGVDGQNFALIAGALSVGIGFGMQSVVSNFVSGLILLAERPIRTGDWVVVDGQHGTVRKINVRSTEIETFDRATMIVPNSDLISKTVTNWVLNDSSGRVIIPIGVSYDSDPDQVRDILLECARSNPLVLAYPEPVVFFQNFGDSALDFELRCYLSDIGMGLTVRSDLRFEIMRRFREADIEIPFPQRVVHMPNQMPPPSAPVPPVDEPGLPSRDRMPASGRDGRFEEAGADLDD